MRKWGNVESYLRKYFSSKTQHPIPSIFAFLLNMQTKQPISSCLPYYSKTHIQYCVYTTYHYKCRIRCLQVEVLNHQCGGLGTTLALPDWKQNAISVKVDWATGMTQRKRFKNDCVLLYYSSSEFKSTLTGTGKKLLSGWVQRRLALLPPDGKSSYSQQKSDTVTETPELVTTGTTILPPITWPVTRWVTFCMSRFHGSLTFDEPA